MNSGESDRLKFTVNPFNVNVLLKSASASWAYNLNITLVIGTEGLDFV
jgi:hypothetical protein